MKGRVHPLFGGRVLAQWIRAGGKPERRAIGYFHRLRWHAYWFEHNWRNQSQALAAGPLPEDPVFILGPWRSGTTVLHELLAATGQWYTPQTWQCFNPSTCFQCAPPASDSSSGRPMDAGSISTRSPQEDEFALLLLGEPSLYRAFIDPRRLCECGQQLWRSSPSDLKRWQDFLRGGMRGATTNQLLLKSPSHTFRLPLLRSLFPRAKFIWIGRHVGEVLASNTRMWRAMTGRYGLWDCPEATLHAFLQDMLGACANVLSQCLDDMPQENMLWIDFEDLRTDARQVMSRVWEFLRPDMTIDDPAVASPLDRALGATAVHDGSRANLPAGEPVERLVKLMAAAREQFSSPL